MAVIARWTLDMDAERNVIYGVREGHGHPPVGKPFVSVEVVPDSQLEGAVEALRGAERVLSGVYGHGAADQRKVDGARKMLRDALTAIGGQ